MCKVLNFLGNFGKFWRIERFFKENFDDIISKSQRNKNFRGNFKKVRKNFSVT